MQLDSIILNFNGFLVIKIDSSSLLENYAEGKYIFSTEVYFVDSSTQIINNSDAFYYVPSFDFIFNIEKIAYDYGTINKLTTFVKYYLSFNKANDSTAKVFLYHHNDILLTDLLLDTKNLFAQRRVPKISYKIFKCRFSTAVVKLNYKGEKKKIFIPISKLWQLIPLSLEILDISLVKSNLVIKGF